MMRNMERPVERISRDSGEACSGGPMWSAYAATAVATGDDWAGGDVA